MERFDSAIARRMYWSDREGNGGLCPECGASVQLEFHSYLAAVKDGDDFEIALVSSEKGSFCAQCPVVVLDAEGLAKTIDGSGMGSDSASFTVLGIVDMKVVPEDKKAPPSTTKTTRCPWWSFFRPSPSCAARRRPAGLVLCPALARGTLSVVQPCPTVSGHPLSPRL